MKKQIPALLASLVVTALVGLCIFAVGASALMNKNGVAVQNSPSGSTITVSQDVNSSSQVQQLQSLVAQYQQREQQYQQQLSDAQQQLNQAASQLQQYQMLFQFLASRGIIQVSPNGEISVPRRGLGN